MRHEVAVYGRLWGGDLDTFLAGFSNITNCILNQEENKSKQDKVNE